MASLLKKSSLQNADAFMAIFSLQFNNEEGPYIIQEAANGGYFLTTHIGNRAIFVRGNAVACDCLDFYVGNTADFTFHAHPKEESLFYAQVDASRLYHAGLAAYAWLVNGQRIEQGSF